MNAHNESTRCYLPKLQEKEKQLLNEHEGCTCCRRFYTGHRAKDCQMTANNTWPDAETYIPLTLKMALASKPQIGSLSSCLSAAAAIHSKIEACNDKTDLYVDHPFTVPHLIATLDAFRPNISKFLLPVPAMLDIGCPSVVISSALTNELGLH